MSERILSPEQHARWKHELLGTHGDLLLRALQRVLTAWQRGTIKDVDAAMSEARETLENNRWRSL